MSAFYLQVWDSGFGMCLVVRLPCPSPLASAPAQASAKPLSILEFGCNDGGLPIASIVVPFFG